MGGIQARTIEDDGERMIPDFHHDAVVYAEHMVRYLFASRFVAGKKVLDVASGVGYGSDMLKAAGAAQVIGVDRSSDAVAYGATRHATFQPDFLVGDAEWLPLPDGRFDVVVAFEAIEHVPDYRRFLTEVKRVLHRDGLFLVSSPNRGIYVEGNPFHTKEFTFAELDGILKGCFRHVETLGQDAWITSTILTPSTLEKADQAIAGGLKAHKAVGKPEAETLYIVSLCSDAPLPRVGQYAVLSSLYEMRSYMEQIARLDSDIARLESDVTERDGRLAEKDGLLAEKDGLLAEKDGLLADKDVALGEKDAALADLHAMRRDQAHTRRRLRSQQGELDGLRRRLGEIENSRGWRLLQRVQPVIRVVAPRGSLRFRLLMTLLRAGEALLTARPLRPVARLVRWPLQKLRRRPAGGQPGAKRPQVRRLRVGCYGEHCWTVGGGTVHAIQLLAPLTPYYDVELLLPPGVPIRDRQWYRDNLLIDIGDIKVRPYANGVEDTYDVWLSVWNEHIWPAKTPKRLNMVFFPFVSLDGAGYTHITNSNYSAAYVRERYQTDDVVVISPCIDAEEFRTGPKEPMILHVSRFALPSAFADKAHVTMIQAFKQLCRRGLTGWRLVLAGAALDEGEAAYAAHLAKHAYGFPIELRQNLSAQELRDLYAKASMYWHATGFSVKEPAAQEHFGITILEGMASGAVPIVLNSGGPPEIIGSGEHGYLFNSKEELVEYTWDVATRPQLWKRLSRAARQRVEAFGPNKTRARMLSTVCKTEKVSIIIGTHNNLGYLKGTVESLLRTTPPGFELIIVDNGSSDGTGVYLASLDYPHLRVIRNRGNQGFAAFNNQGQRTATRPYILYLNDDMELAPGWLEPLIEMLDAHPHVGAVGSRLLYPDGRVYHDGKMFSREDLTPHHIGMGDKPSPDETPIEVDTLTANAMLVRRELAGFSPDYRRGYYEDTDLCMRIKVQGQALVLHRGSVAIHYHGMTMGRDQAATERAQARNKRLFLQRWAEHLPSLVYLASEEEMVDKELHCQPLLAPEELEESWPLSKRLER